MLEETTTTPNITRIADQPQLHRSRADVWQPFIGFLSCFWTSFSLSKTNIIREDLDLFFLLRQEVGQLSLSVFVPFPVLDTII